MAVVDANMGNGSGLAAGSGRAAAGACAMLVAAVQGWIRAPQSAPVHAFSARSFGRDAAALYEPSIRPCGACRYRRSSDQGSPCAMHSNMELQTAAGRCGGAHWVARIHG